jgi:cytochrome c oxidase assembly factor CtaG
LSTSSGWRFTLLSTLSNLSSFQLDPLLLVPVLAIGIAYGVGYRRFTQRRHAGGGRFRTRAGLFVVGYTALVLALISPLHAVGEEYFSVHMVQHLLLSLVAAPLLLLSNSMPVLLWAFSPRDRATIGRVVGQAGPTRSLLRWLTKPAIAWTLFLLAQWLWHLPAAYDLALQNRWVHYLEHISFFATAVMFWWPVIGAAPLPSPLGYPARLAYTFLAWLPGSFLGAGIMLSRAPLYPHYVAAAEMNGTDALVDQQLAGLIMWIPGDVLFAAILILLFVAFMNNEERKEVRIDRELDARDLAAAEGSVQLRNQRVG